jgi:short subunit dehydrogenase-like uncharacterized protein
MQDEMRKRNYQIQSVRYILEESKGPISTGALASLVETFESCSVIEILAFSNPFYLNPRDDKTNYPLVPFQDKSLCLGVKENYLFGYDFKLGYWTTPFFFQSVDFRVVNRSNALLYWKYGQAFIFCERMKVSFLAALILSILYFVFHLLALFTTTRKIMKLLLPKDHHYIKQQLLDSGHFQIKLVATGKDSSTGRLVTCYGSISAQDGDPSYRQTAKMVAECTICLFQNDNSLLKRYGVLTPAVAFGEQLKDRLTQKGIQFYFNLNISTK